MKTLLIISLFLMGIGIYVASITFFVNDFYFVAIGMVIIGFLLFLGISFYYLSIVYKSNNRKGVWLMSSIIGLVLIALFLLRVMI